MTSISELELLLIIVFKPDKTDLQ